MKDTLRVMTLNVAHGARRPIPAALLRTRTVARNLDAIADLVRRAGADVVALQEIDRACAFSKNVDHFEWIARGAAMPFHLHAPHGRRDGLGMLHGHALLSQHPLEAAEERRFARRACHDKGFVVATMTSPQLGARSIDVVSVHQTWGEYRVFYVDDDGALAAMPVNWTDVAEPDPFVTLACGRAYCRLSDLLRLCAVIAEAQR